MQKQTHKTTRLRLTVQGQVQGVGFRPFVFVTAEDLGLTGFVNNTSQGVVIEVQGSAKSISIFCRRLQSKAPPLAKITSITRDDLATIDQDKAFSILKSTNSERHSVLISPDMSLCQHCQNEMNDPQNKRYLYPFTNCTNCGPRYSITHSIPYDRASTSMACFLMCQDCTSEYQNPHNRRFHAQPNACPICGPTIWLVHKAPDNPTADGPTNISTTTEHLTGQKALEELAQQLVRGKIAVVKGLGGFHLVCDATNRKAVELLRKRKQRPHKSFAVMLQNIKDAREYVKINKQAKDLLLSQERPAVICPVHNKTYLQLSPSLAPDLSTLAVMLPYTPLHLSLMAAYAKACKHDKRNKPPILVMTSGNIAGNPICLGNREALQELSTLADLFLLHNRDILIRVDDSVVFPDQAVGTIFFRRARGYVPQPLPLPHNTNALECKQHHTSEKTDSNVPVLLGTGADLKNTLCFNKNTEAFVSQHIGDMENLDTAFFHQETSNHLQKLLQIKPQFVVCDLHPDFHSSRLAKDTGLPVYTLQHHMAHAHAVLAENMHTGPALVLALDGTGYGNDGHIWGGELLLVSPQAGHQERIGHLSPLTLPGGEAAIKEPWRIAHALLWEEQILRNTPEPSASYSWLKEFAPAATLLNKIMAAKINCPVTSSAGRVFDVASSILGLCHKITYEGQAAIKLEAAQWITNKKSLLSNNCQSKRLDKLLAIPDESLYPCFVVEERSGYLLDTHSLLLALAKDKINSADSKARIFHASFARGLAKMVVNASSKHNVKHIGLSGGCMQNITLLRLLVSLLKQNDLIPLLHKQLPPGDGCISYGQVAWGLWNIPYGQSIPIK